MPRTLETTTRRWRVSCQTIQGHRRTFVHESHAHLAEAVTAMEAHLQRSWDTVALVPVWLSAATTKTLVAAGGQLARR